MALRAGSVGLGCEAGLGTCRGWGSSRPVALLSAPPEARCAARLEVFGGGRWGEVLVRWRLTVSPVAGAFSPVPLWGHGAVSVAGAEGGPLEGTGYGGRRRRLWTRVGPFSRITSATAPAGGTLRSRGGPPPAVRLGWRLAADLELVRTRGIRLFN